MIALEKVSFSYGAAPVLRDISLHIEKGEFVAVTGPNGTGKSTLVKLMDGLLKPTAGRVLVDGMDTRRVRTSLLAREVGFLFQNPDRQLCQSTVREEILFGLKLIYKDKAEIERRLNDTLQAFSLDPARNPLTASRGEKQRIVLASLLALTPKLLLLDEPTTGLDYRECMEIMTRIQSLNQAGTTVVMISHDMELVQQFSSRVLVVADGTLLADGTPHQVLRKAQVLQDASLLPPQILQLAQALGDEFADTDTYEEMAARIAQRKAELQ